ncbi:ABC transporter substrate-binding protein [Paeniglutamicibacter sulfureus]|uniref:ABC transporter substrate-binding protein n=1 Tax=Paeniglutamicibacter sulfureus TaxID=43666 RepID=UPI0026661400|nr:ABC transporter substrate-binding protein [Paeniglutamicibacter sulfureus]MDO2934028.1 ABC transporter substrate-binding protein [Paeniglutamicibacter sulfureus]
MTTLKLACIDADAPPLFSLLDSNGQRTGYEPDAAKLVASRMGRTIEWVVMGWDEMLPSVREHQVDAVWCGQGIIPERQAVVDFTRPYAVFDETVLVRKGDPARTPADIVGYRVAAIDGSANMALARTFEGAIIVPFSGDTVYEDMLAAVADSSVDAMVDDDVVLVPLGDDPRYDVAFTVATRNAWGIGVAKDNLFLREELNVALAAVIADGSLREVWDTWMPTLGFPLGHSLEAIAGSRA